MLKCWCGYTAPCQLQLALHIVLVHADGEVALLPGWYSDKCIACLYGDLAKYELAPSGRGYVGATRVGSVLMQVPSARGPYEGARPNGLRGEEA